MTVPPAFYFYIRSLVHSDFRWRRGYLAAFFLPLYYLLSWVIHLFGLEYGFYRLFAARPDWYLYGWIAGYLLYSVGWGAAALRVLYQDARPERYRRQSGWLRWYTVGYLVAVGIAGEIFAYLVVTQGYSVDFEYGLLILFEVFVLTLVYQSLRRSTYSGWLADRLYGPSAITEDRLPQLRERLDAYVRDARPYLDPELRLATVARAIGITENELSQLFAHYPSGNFYGYVNGYRLGAFERALREGAADRLTIPGLARECGFKSKTSFYRLFREHYGTTPSNYLRELQSSTP
jgi:AraC-like DNA-binding protein